MHRNIELQIYEYSQKIYSNKNLRCAANLTWAALLSLCATSALGGKTPLISLLNTPQGGKTPS